MKNLTKISVHDAIVKWPEISKLIQQRSRLCNQIAPAQVFANQRGYSLADLHNVHDRADRNSGYPV